MLVSVVMPTFKHHKYIAKSINSILKQTHKEIELVIVPVMLHNRTLNILKKYKDPRIKIVLSKYALITHQMNLGMFASSGQYFMFFASDDYLLPDSVEKELSFSLDNNLVIAYPDFYIGNQKLKIKSVKKCPDFSPRISLDKSSYMIDVSLVDRKEFVNYFPLKFKDGKARLRYTWRKMVQNSAYRNRILRYPHPTFIYRMHKKSVHLHGSQNKFECVAISPKQPNSFKDSGISLGSSGRIVKRDYCLYYDSPELLLKDKNLLKYKRIILNWLEIGDITPFQNMPLVNHITSDEIISAYLNSNGVEHLKLSGFADVVSYIKQDRY